MSDDDIHGFQGFLVDRARKKQAAQQQQQPSSTGHTFNRVARFDGSTPSTHWLSAAWSPDGSLVAAGGRNVNRKHGELEIWNGRTGHHEGHSMRHLTHDLAGPVVSLAWSPESAHLATVERDVKSGLPVLNVRSQAEAKRPVSLPEGAEITQVSWSPDGSLLAVSAGGSRATLLIDPASGQLRRTLEGLSGPVAWEPGGRRIAGPDGADVAIFDALTGQRERVLSGQSAKATAIAWATGGKVLAFSDGERIRVIDADTGEGLWNLPWATSEGDRSDDPSVHYLGWLDGGRYLLEFRKHGALSRTDASTVIGTVTAWDITYHTLFVLNFHETINRVQYPPAEILAGPQGGRQTLIFFDDQPPQVWEIAGDLPDLQP